MGQQSLTLALEKPLFWGEGNVQIFPQEVTLILSLQGKRYKNSLETVGTPDSGRGRSEKKAIK